MQQDQYYQQQPLQKQNVIHPRPAPVPEPEIKRRRMETFDAASQRSGLMDVDVDLVGISPDCNQFPPPASKPPSPYEDDEFVYQILRNSGLRNHSDIVNYCVNTGIPVSRMLQLDLMRKLSN